MSDDWICLSDVAALLGYSTSSARRIMREYDVPVRRVDKVRHGQPRVFYHRQKALAAGEAHKRKDYTEAKRQGGLAATSGDHAWRAYAAPDQKTPPGEWRDIMRRAHERVKNRVPHRDIQPSPVWLRAMERGIDS